MAWDLQTVLEAVKDTESRRANLVSSMLRYEKAWKLDFWTGDEQKAAEIEGRILYTSPAPRNIVSLATNLISGRIRVTCPAYEETKEALNAADDRARFLELLIQKQANIQDMNLIDALGWFGVTRGRLAVQLAWVQDILPESQTSFMPPILYRVLDPLGVGVERDALGTKWAYHKYHEKISSAKGRYPKAFEGEEGVLKRQDPDADKEVEVVDFWYMEKGVVYNAVIVDNVYGKKPKKTKYPQIPIFERNNDPTPTKDERWRSAGIMEGMLESWGALNLLHSMHLTSIGRYFWPTLYLRNPEQEEIPTFDTGMGAVNELPLGVEFTTPPNDQPDVALATSAIQMLSKYQQDATFPDILLGDAGQMKAAYGLNLMASTAVRRISATKEQMQTLLEQANSLALWCIANYAPSGVTLYGYDSATRKTKGVTLDSDQVGKRYDNNVDIETDVPGAKLQEMVMAIQLVVHKIISKGTYRRQWIPADKEPPSDEEIRILIERIEEDPDLIRDRIREAYADYYGKELPPGEPDFKATPQQMPPQQMGPPPMPPQGGMQPVPMNMAPGGMPSYEAQGGISPDMLGMQQGDPQTQMIMEMMRQGQVGPQDMNRMMQNQYRRR